MNKLKILYKFAQDNINTMGRPSNQIPQMPQRFSDFLDQARVIKNKADAGQEIS